MPITFHVHQQAFRVYDPRAVSMSREGAAGFALVIAAPFHPELVEEAMGQLAYGQTGIGVDWADVLHVAGASRRTAHGFAYRLRAHAHSLEEIGRLVREQEEEGRAGFIVLQTFSWEQDFTDRLERVAELQDLISRTSTSHFVLNMARSSAGPAAIVIAFAGPPPASIKEIKRMSDVYSGPDWGGDDNGVGGQRASAEQVAWLGELQAQGVAEKKLLIVGYSFYGSDEEIKREDTVVAVVRRVLIGTETHAFWRSIASYFQFDKVADFWCRVGFIEYVPHGIGPEDDKYSVATSEQIEGAADRVLKVMIEQDADIAFVFSTKAAYHFKQEAKRLGGVIRRFDVADQDGCHKDQYFDEVAFRSGAKERRVILGPHPQGAHIETMRAMVTRVLRSRPDEFAGK